MKTVENYLIFIFCVFLTVSCVTEFVGDIDQFDENVESSSDDLSVPLMTKSYGTSSRVVYASNATKLPNPYALSNVQDVYDGYGINVSLAPTDIYVMFMPSDSTQLHSLYDDYSLELFDHPLDIELESGDIYCNDTIPDGTLTILYTTVKPDFVFPTDIPYKYLEDCYIPKDGEVIEYEDPVTKATVSIDVEEAAYINSGYSPVVEVNRAIAKKPQGNIGVHDNTGSLDVPLKGVKVRCHRFVKWASAYTDSLGHYEISKQFRYKPFYSIVFTNEKGFDIWGSYGPIAKACYHMGKDTINGHSEIIGETEDAWEWAAINNAAYEYYDMCDSLAISPPPPGLKIWSWKFTNVSSAPMLDKILCQSKKTLAESFFDRTFDENVSYIMISILQYFMPDITIGSRGANYGDIYRKVTHELSHASHFMQAGSEFWNDYINYIVNNWGYGDGTDTNYELCAVGEMYAFAVSELLLDEKYKLKKTYYSGGPSQQWLKPQIFWNLVKKNILTYKEIFDCLQSSVRTYRDLLEVMYAMYPLKATFIRNIFGNDKIYYGWDVLSSPNKIYLNTLYTISWKCSDEFYNLSEIEYRFMEEKYFDAESMENIEIHVDENAPMQAKIVIRDSGHYVIEARAVSTGETREFHVIHMPQPDYNLPEPVNYDGYCFATDEPLTELGTPTGDYVYYNDITFGVNSPISHRTAALLHTNFCQQTFGVTRRMDVRYVHADCDTLLISPGSNIAYSLPSLPICSYHVPITDAEEMSIYENDWVEYGTTKSYGYYTLEYPKSGCRWVY